MKLYFSELAETLGLQARSRLQKPSRKFQGMQSPCSVFRAPSTGRTKSQACYGSYTVKGTPHCSLTDSSKHTVVPRNLLAVCSGHQAAIFHLNWEKDTSSNLPSSASSTHLSALQICAAPHRITALCWLSSLSPSPKASFISQTELHLCSSAEPRQEGRCIDGASNDGQ